MLRNFAHNEMEPSLLWVLVWMESHEYPDSWDPQRTCDIISLEKALRLETRLHNGGKCSIQHIPATRAVGNPPSVLGTRSLDSWAEK